MPRQIIDVESSRPRYVRRLVLVWAIVVIAAAAAAYLAYLAYEARHAGTPGGNAPSPRVSWQASITPAAAAPRTPKESPCFVA